MNTNDLQWCVMMISFWIPVIWIPPSYQNDINDMIASQDGITRCFGRFDESSKLVGLYWRNIPNKVYPKSTDAMTTVPETITGRKRKWMVGRWHFPLGPGLFSGTICFREAFMHPAGNRCEFWCFMLVVQLTFPVGISNVWKQLNSTNQMLYSMMNCL